MAVTLTAIGFVDDAGHFAFDRKAEFLEALAAFAGQEVVVSVQDKTKYRSLRANNYYWAQVVAAGVTESGQDADTLHAFWCEQFLPNERKQLEFFNKVTGQRLRTTVDTRRSSKLTGHAFYDYVEECRLWLQTWLGVSTPDPDPEYWRTRAKATEAA